MALPDNILVKSGTAIVFADVTDHAPGASAANNLGTRTAQIDMTAVATTAARQSDKVDLGASRAPLWRVIMAIEIQATPTAGQTIDLYWAPSQSTTAGMGNPAGITGADAAYTGQASNLDASLKQLQYIGSFIATAVAEATAVQVGVVATFSPMERYGSLVVHNNSGASLGTDMVESSIRMEPTESEITD